jgi:hypothetical protein
MSLLKVNEVQNFNGSSLTLTASTVSTSAQLNTGGNVSVTGSLNVSDDSTTRTNLGIGSIATQDSNNVSVTGGSITGTTIVPTSSFIFRNKIINGNFDIWQRGTSQTSSDYGSVDRWGLTHATSSKTASQQSFANGQTDVPGNPKYYLRHVITSSSGGYVLASQPIEGSETLSGKTVTLSFYAKADSNKNLATEFQQYFGSGGSASSQITGIGVTTHNLTTSWQKFTATITIPSISGKTIGTDGNDYLAFNFWFEAGSSFNSRTNSLGNQSGTFDIAQVQVEEGTVATPFEHRPIGVELGLCQRYYYKLGAGTKWGSQGSGSGFQIKFYMEPARHPVQMRASPTLSLVSGGSAYFSAYAGVSPTVLSGDLGTVNTSSMSFSGIENVNEFGVNRLGIDGAGHTVGAGYGSLNNFINCSAEL